MRITRHIRIRDTAGLKVVYGVSHRDQKTLGLALASLERQSLGYAKRRIFSGIAALLESLDACLDFATDERADILVHSGSDVVLEPFALELLLGGLDMERNCLALGGLSDILNRVDSGMALTAFNMRVFGSGFRLSDTPGVEADLCGHVERLTSKACTSAGAKLSLGYRQPIWTPIEMYMACRHAAVSRGNSERARLVSFLTSELIHNATNKTLQCGMLGVDVANAPVVPAGSENRATMESEFLRASAHLCLDGSEYYVYHRKFKRLAQRILGTYQDCVTIEER
jgi:hypothetical protein